MMAEEEELVVAGEVVAEVIEREAPAEGGAGANADASKPETAQVGSVEFLGRWNEKKVDPAMPVKMRGYDVSPRFAFGKLVEELVQKNAPSGIFAISEESYYKRISWSASPDDVSYQRHGEAQLAAMEVKKRSPGEEPLLFADLEGVVDDFGASCTCGHKGVCGCGPPLEGPHIAVYRVTPPRGGLDPDKWVGRPPPPAPEDLYTGPRDDGLLSTDEISGEYMIANSCFDFLLAGLFKSMTVVPYGPDTIDVWHSKSNCLPPFVCGSEANNYIWTRKPGTNKFGCMTFSADGTAEWPPLHIDDSTDRFKKRPTSQKRTFQKVDARDLAGDWRGCWCSQCVVCWPLSSSTWTTKKALDEDRYEESGRRCGLLPPWSIPAETYTRRYYDDGGGRSYPTNGFDQDQNRPFFADFCDCISWLSANISAEQNIVYRSSGYAVAPRPFYFTKKIG